MLTQYHRKHLLSPTYRTQPFSGTIGYLQEESKTALLLPLPCSTLHSVTHKLCLQIHWTHQCPQRSLQLHHRAHTLFTSGPERIPLQSRDFWTGVRSFSKPGHSLSMFLVPSVSPSKSYSPPDPLSLTGSFSTLSPALQPQVIIKPLHVCCMLVLSLGLCMCFTPWRSSPEIAI